MYIRLNNNNNNNNNKKLYSFVKIHVKHNFIVSFSLFVGAKERVRGLKTLSVPLGDSPVPKHIGVFCYQVFNDDFEVFNIIVFLC